MALATYLIKKQNYMYVLPGKFTSDPIEGRFGWYRQVNGGNFYMSIQQLFQAEKKICCLTLLQQNALHTVASLKSCSITSNALDDEEATEDTAWVEDWAKSTEITAVSDDDDASVTYYVAGYVGRCISRRRKCDSCRELLIESACIPSLSVVENAQNLLLAMADRGGLSAPTQYCYAVCAMGVQMYTKLRSNDDIRHKFFCLKNQRASFVSSLVTAAAGNQEHTMLLNIKCGQDHINFSAIVRSLFNCFAKNELKRLNQCEIEPPAKMSRTVRKLTSKSTQKR